MSQTVTMDALNELHGVLDDLFTTCNTRNVSIEATVYSAKENGFIVHVTANSTTVEARF